VKVLLFILQKEFRLIFRDKIILAMMTFVPTMQLIILPMAADFDVKNVNVAFIDHDQSTTSSQLMRKVMSSGYFRIVDLPFSYNEGIKLIEDGSADIVVEVPLGMERSLIREGRTTINVSINAINGTKASLGGAYLSTVFADYNREIDLPMQAPSQGAMVNVKQIELVQQNWYNVRAEYKYYMVPGILVLLLTIIGGFITALNIVKEKELGTIEQINVTPIKKWQFILGKLIPFWIVGLTVFTLGLVVMYVVYGIFPEGSLLTLYAFAAVYMMALLGFGLLISTFSSNQLQAMFVAYFFIMIFTLMSGFFTSIDSMPNWARRMSSMTPVTHFIFVVRLIVLKGSSFHHVYQEFLYLIGFGVVLNGLAIWNYRKTQ